MALLPTGDMDVVWQSLMEEFSGVRSTIPVNKNQFRTFLESVDGLLEQCEIDIAQSVPVGPIRDWLIANPTIGRSMVIRVIEKRREVL